jgi:hypothetical protein
MSGLYDIRYHPEIRGFALLETSRVLRDLTINLTIAVEKIY